MALEVKESINAFVVGQGLVDELLNLVTAIMNQFKLSNWKERYRLSYLIEEAKMRFEVQVVSIYTTTIQ